MTLSDIFNGAVGYIRANPKATLGLTAIVVVVMQVITLLATIGPLEAASRFDTHPSELSWGVVGAWTGSAAAGLLVSWLGGMLLSGILTVVVGRAVFGSPITISEAWARVRGRILALIGLALLEGAGLVALAAWWSSSWSGGRRRQRSDRGTAGLPAGAAGRVAGGLPVHGADVRARADRAGEAAAGRRDHEIVCAGNRRLLAGSGHPTADRDRGRPGWWRDLGAVWHRRPDTAGRHRERGFHRYVSGGHDPVVHRLGDQPDHYRAIHRRGCRAALHRPADAGRGIRSGSANRGRRRPAAVESTDTLWLTRPL
ncbi:putative cONSERVED TRANSMEMBRANE PROTEIN [Mycobacterium ulcerans str. Harvey]|uniref:CONSERVED TRANSMEMBRANE PROTEIN n=1 Tax=Mycobacterium ulcerans str. Harvey TaxID=1299332 RepID=A0ABP3A7H2_MYCUL|nr:putative cONSERVED TRANSMEMBRANE PROTEIN [Mycobacterium ulcerans str. Harvey]